MRALYHRWTALHVRLLHAWVFDQSIEWKGFMLTWGALTMPSRIWAWKSALVSCGFWTRIWRACPGFCATRPFIWPMISNSSGRDSAPSALEIRSLDPPVVGGGAPCSAAMDCAAPRAASTPSTCIHPGAQLSGGMQAGHHLRLWQSQSFESTGSRPPGHVSCEHAEAESTTDTFGRMGPLPAVLGGAVLGSAKDIHHFRPAGMTCISIEGSILIDACQEAANTSALPHDRVDVLLGKGDLELAAREVGLIQVSHGTLRGLSLVVLYESKALLLPSLSICHDPATRPLTSAPDTASWKA